MEAWLVDLCVKPQSSVSQWPLSDLHNFLKCNLIMSYSSSVHWTCLAFCICFLINVISHKEVIFGNPDGCWVSVSTLSQVVTLGFWEGDFPSWHIKIELNFSCTKLNCWNNQLVCWSKIKSQFGSENRLGCYFTEKRIDAVRNPEITINYCLHRTSVGLI